MPDIGATLQEARMRARIDISEVESATKIRAKYLRAIENEEWEMLPGPTFVKSFLRTYAEYLGIDGKLLVEEYKLRHEPVPSEAELQSLGPPLAERRRSIRPPTPPRLPRGLIVGTSLAGLLAVLIVLGSIGDDSPDTPVATDTTPRTTPARARPRPRPVPRVTRLTLIPTGEVYVCLRNSAGRLLVNTTLTPDNGPESFRGRRFRLTVGNSNLRMRVNGRVLSVAPNAGATTYELTPRGRRRLSEERNAC
ncbi:MAG TPA: helix-turn-helix domain-containing protein [Solirubrobacteraceae bacterium]|nr:helix-turn-helix domain-containing protein [Solirubrobacteraceae bacterium]